MYYFTMDRAWIACCSKHFGIYKNSNGFISQPGNIQAGEPSYVNFDDSSFFKKPFQIPRYPAELVSKLIEDLNKTKGYIRCLDTKPYVYIDLNDPLQKSASELTDGFGNKRAGEFRRAIRKSAVYGELFFETITGEHYLFEHFFQIAVDVENQSWKSEEESSLYKDPVRFAFFKDLLGNSTYYKNKSVIHLLKLGDIYIGMQMGVVYDNKYWILKIGYNDNYSACSPGTLTMLYVVDWARKLKLDTIEFMGNPDDWTYRWSTKERTFKAIQKIPITINGFLTLFEIAKLKVTNICYKT